MTWKYFARGLAGSGRDKPFLRFGTTSLLLAVPRVFCQGHLQLIDRSGISHSVSNRENINCLGQSTESRNASIRFDTVAWGLKSLSKCAYSCRCIKSEWAIQDVLNHLRWLATFIAPLGTPAPSPARPCRRTLRVSVYRKLSKRVTSA